ncbi:murein L,D-transpeptidase catalytic domain family protein [Sphingobacterium corticibacter]|uniref:Murein L,D-transpeptidase catalytic domain family protein n=1 Tax=Sphingobacterium corticibacter TaxID=2171749 RepID=A0A2T8HGA4_9SPHI|nr:murein L,D-transpeptidase catalytic domain family protein [Sphingobacterium corticibacter]PVH24466.1 hypothetical protein DC487_13070 [Sphingobacterium corticibacter]
MRKIFFGILASVSLIFIAFASFKDRYVDQPAEKITAIDIAKPDPFYQIRAMYDSLHVDSILNYQAFEEAMYGYESMRHRTKKELITVIDFTLPSTEKRLYVIDLKNKKLLHHSVVAHGRNTGENYATNFSNKHGSFQSSLGFYVTAETYQGGNGYSLRLDGLEKGINDQARARAIVMHGADYCNVNLAKSMGRLGRSYGCPALPREINAAVINTIKGGSMMYIYANNKNYMASSNILKTKTTSKTMLAQHDEVENTAAPTVVLN